MNMKMEKDIRREQGVYAVHVVDGDSDVNYVYIGSGFLGDRVVGNTSKLRRNVHSNRELQEMYNKFGNVKVEVLEVCSSKKEAREVENDYIEYFKMLDGVVVCNKYVAYVPTKKYKRKLNENDVIDIHEMLNEGKRNSEIAKQYDVDPSTISRIKNGIRWQSVVS